VLRDPTEYRSLRRWSPVPGADLVGLGTSSRLDAGPSSGAWTGGQPSPDATAPSRCCPG